MKRWWLVVLFGVLAATACTGSTARKSPADDPFAVAQEQALEVGKVMGGLRLCNEASWQAVFQEFMAAKRAQGFDDKQTALIAAWAGIGESQAEPEILECSANGAARRSAAIAELRQLW